MGTDMDLFSEVYGCYFAVVAKILAQAQDGMSRAEIEKLVNSNAFGDSAFHLLPKLFSGEWSLLEKKDDGNYHARLQSPETERPMTSLERSWLKALLMDKRIHLFVSRDELSELENSLSDVAPLFIPDDFHIFDSAADGDSYDDENYIRNFKAILNACVSKTPLRIEYESGQQKRFTRTILPYKLNYSGRDDKFRLLGVFMTKGARYKGVTLNLARIRSVEMPDPAQSDAVQSDAVRSDTARPGIAFSENLKLEKYFDCNVCSEPIVLEISKERNALERCMLQFASWEKQTEYDEERDCYTCRIYYDGQDETELLIRILSFGPVVKVLGPDSFLKQIKERVKKQYELNFKLFGYFCLQPKNRLL